MCVRGWPSASAFSYRQWPPLVSTSDRKFPLSFSCVCDCFLLVFVSVFVFIFVFLCVYVAVIWLLALPTQPYL